MSNLGKIELIINNWDQIFHFHFRYCCPQKYKTGHFSSKVCEIYNNKKHSSKTLFFNVRVRCRLVAILLPSSSWLFNKHPNGNKNNGFLKVFHCHDKPPKAVSKISLCIFNHCLTKLKRICKFVAIYYLRRHGCWNTLMKTKTTDFSDCFIVMVNCSLCNRSPVHKFKSF